MLMVVAGVALAPAVSAQDHLDTSRLEKKVAQKLKAVRTDPKARQAAIRKGREAALFCAHCHGRDGNSTKPEIPRLAGQNADYLVDQIQRFASGKRQDYIMTSLAGTLSDDDKIALAVYYASETPRRVAADPASENTLARGREKYLTVCMPCHGPHGKGNKGYARIAGQHERYIIHTLTNFHNGTGGRTSEQMSAVARTLSDDDITDLAAYVHNLE
jgi:cbb3-type cytochrome c oxidase subunit III